MILFNVFETKVVVNGQLIYIPFIDWNRDYTSYHNIQYLNKHDIKKNETKHTNIKISGTSTETPMFQPSQTQCLSPTRDKSPSKFTSLWLEMKNYIRYCTNYKCYDLAAFDVQWQVHLNMLNVFETKSIHLIVHKFNVFKTKIK